MGICQYVTVYKGFNLCLVTLVHTEERDSDEKQWKV